ncbi:osteoclast-stimulating factor 1-like [Hylaeus anthracinus]|uniref:osteoclast-stimulating factor 1-like n=1 Tax=Hylaeus anthracinus TaxID=313031 RepID=UPI0023B896CF|nr:osteoclast-stimulating factor 1-like [Hylaeus anthracinus]
MTTKMTTSVQTPVPPKTVWKPGKVKVVRALYKYTAQNADELSFDEGEVLYVYDKNTEPNWWRAKCGNQDGLVPANYVEEQTEEIELPLHDAARRGNLSLLTEYIKQGVLTTSLDAMGNIPLYWAARAGHLDCVKKILSTPNPVINVQNKMGETPLHVAASRGHIDVVNLLLDYGADPTIKNNDNLVAEQLSSDLSIKNIIQLSQRQSNKTYGYTDDDYNDDSD